MHPVAVEVTEVGEAADVTRVRQARAGDTRAFEALARARLPGAYRLALAILGSEAEAAGATQDALLAAWRELPRLREETGFDAWFHRILVSECRMRARQQAHDRGGLDTEAERDARRAAREVSTLERDAVLDRLEAAFDPLDADDRTLVVLHDLEGRQLSEIAAALHMPVGTAKWRLHEARRALIRALDALG